ncbi:MAG: MBL fold metallo-hydrolase [Candidatus Sericytochromatia bacterium]
MAVEFFMLAAGHCTHSEHIVIQGGAQRTIKFPSLVGVITHPREGVILFDVGYSQGFVDKTREWPYMLYGMLTPVTYAASDGAAAQLRARGIRPEDVKTILLSHFHADHIGGARDFPNARFVCYQDAYRLVRGKTGFAALQQAYLPGLLPDDFESRAIFAEDRPLIDISDHYAPFEQGVDLFGDGSLVVVPLPGHAHGHFGVIVATEPEPTFLVADACWLSKAYRENRLPHLVTHLIFASPPQYRQSLDKIHRLHKARPQVRILPSHCQEVWDAYVPAPLEVAR